MVRRREAAARAAKARAIETGTTKRNDRDASRAHVVERLVEFAELMGEEVALVEKKLRANFNVELAELRAELHELRGERNAGVIDLPDDWRSHAAH